MNTEKQLAKIKPRRKDTVKQQKEDKRVRTNNRYLRVVAVNGCNVDGYCGFCSVKNELNYYLNEI